MGDENQLLAKVNNTGCWKLFSKYIQELLEKVLQKKTMIKVILDNQVYVCLHFTPLTGHGLKYLDFNVVKVETRQRVKTFAPDEDPAMVVAKMKKNALVFDPGGGC